MSQLNCRVKVNPIPTPQEVEQRIMKVVNKVFFENANYYRKYGKSTYPFTNMELEILYLKYKNNHEKQ